MKVKQFLIYPRNFSMTHSEFDQWDISKTGFPGISTGKESACNEGDPGSIHGLGRSAGERIGYPLQYSWASLVAQPVKSPLAMWEIWVLIPGLGRYPGEGKGYPLQCSALENSMDFGITKSQT